MVCYIEYESGLKFKNLDLNLCSHIVAIDEIWTGKFVTGEGMQKLFWILFLYTKCVKLTHFIYVDKVRIIDFQINQS